ncbi:MAG: TrmH family RNA methyltransferase [Bacteroidales bacterium]|jgi:TrmH family RNA methyltransferase|nr:TrmH family RNA methyltransferase [Bacteroidales bacterium]
MEKRSIHSAALFRTTSYPDSVSPPIIVGWQIKTPENMGNIIRLADNTGCKQVIFVSNGEPVRMSKVKKTASSGFDSVNFRFCKPETLGTIIPPDYHWVAVETSSDSVNIFETRLPQKIVMLVGNEKSGIDPRILDQCHQIVHIPLFGKNTSLNVSHALAVALFEWQRQFIH